MINLMLKITYFGLIAVVHSLAMILSIMLIGFAGGVGNHELSIFAGYVGIYLLVAILIYVAVYKKFIQDINSYRTSVRVIAALSPVWGTALFVAILLFIISKL